MTNITQINWVKAQIAKNGRITRNECLRRYISRLGAIIFELKKEDYEFLTFYQKTKQGRDFVYLKIN